MEIITLSNGLRIGNFSSPHKFTFEDGSVLQAIDPDESNRLKILFSESPYKYDKYTVTLEFTLTDDVINHMKDWNVLAKEDKVDFVLCPLPMITAMHKAGDDVGMTIFRAVRMKDRINKVLCIDKFTI